MTRNAKAAALKRCTDKRRVFLSGFTRSCGRNFVSNMFMGVWLVDTLELPQSPQPLNMAVIASLRGDDNFLHPPTGGEWHDLDLAELKDAAKAHKTLAGRMIQIGHTWFNPVLVLDVVNLVTSPGKNVDKVAYQFIGTAGGLPMLWVFNDDCTQSGFVLPLAKH